MAVRTEIDEEGGEGYFASVSDLMVGVLFVFLLMLTVFALNFRDAEEIARTQQEIAEQKEAENRELRTLLEKAVAQLNEELRRRQALRERLLTTLETSLEARGVIVQIDREAGILRLSGDVLFDSGRDDYTDEAAAILPTLAQVLGDALPCYATGRPDSCAGDAETVLETVLVEGHTDRQPWGGLSVAASQAKNDELSAQRALRVFQTLRRTAPVLDELRNEADLPLFGISGYGERRPLGGADAADRRIDVRFVLSSRTSEELEAFKRRIDALLEAMR